MEIYNYRSFVRELGHENNNLNIIINDVNKSAFQSFSSEKI